MISRRSPTGPQILYQIPLPFSTVFEGWLWPVSAWHRSTTRFTERHRDRGRSVSHSSSSSSSSTIFKCLYPDSSSSSALLLQPYRVICEVKKLRCFCQVFFFLTFPDDLRVRRIECPRSQHLIRLIEPTHALVASGRHTDARRRWTF